MFFFILLLLKYEKNKTIKKNIKKMFIEILLKIFILFSTITLKDSKGEITNSSDDTQFSLFHAINQCSGSGLSLGFIFVK